MRTLLTFVVFFAAGLAAAAGYFYGRHPEHSPIDDVPQLRRDVEGMIERGRKLREAWETKPAETAADPEPQTPPIKSVEEPQEPAEKPPVKTAPEKAPPAKLPKNPPRKTKVEK